MEAVRLTAIMTDSDSHHLRNVSASTTSTTSTTGTSYSFILEHILSYPGTYELPLRTMYALNCASRSQSSSPTANSPTSADFYEHHPELQTANTRMTNSLLAQISQLPSQPASLPPSFITMFVKRCFTPELHWVDFPQALTALDYLRDLEARRRKEVKATLGRLGVHPDRMAADADAMRKGFPGAANWVAELELRQKRGNDLYTHLYICLRRWVSSAHHGCRKLVLTSRQILINEMSLQPFNKHNCIAMLNTLYPPVNKPNPTAKLTPTILAKQRDGFFRYIRAVEHRGVAILKTLQDQGALEGEENGWPDVHRHLEKYLRLANSTINECSDITSISYFNVDPPSGPLPNIPQHTTESEAPKTARKTDSGVSFNSSRPASPEAPMPQTPRKPYVEAAATAQTPSKVSSTPRKAGTTLERIARELGRLRKKPEVEEIIKEPAPAKAKTPRGLRKMKSLGTLGEMQQSSGNSSSVLRFGRRSPKPDLDTLRQERLAYEDRSGLSQSRLGYEF